MKGRLVRAAGAGALALLICAAAVQIGFEHGVRPVLRTAGLEIPASAPELGRIVFRAAAQEARDAIR